MNAVVYVFMFTYIAIVAYVIVSLIKGRESVVELRPTFVEQHIRRSSTKLSVFGKVLRIMLFNATTVLIVLSIIISSTIAATAYSDRRTEFVQSLEEPVKVSTVLIKLSEPIGRNYASTVLQRLIDRAEFTTFIYRATLKRGLELRGFPGVKWVAIGVNGAMATRLNISRGEIVTGCRTNQAQTLPKTWEGIKCASEALSKIRITPLEPLLPVLGYIGPEPLTPSLDMVIVSDIQTITKILELEDDLTTEILLEGVYVTREELEEILDKLNVDVLHYYYNSTVLMIGSVRVMTTEALISALLVIVSCAIIDVSAYRSLIPEFRSIHERLYYFGLPPWGMTVTLLLHIITATSLAAAASSTLAYYLYSARQAAISALVSTLSGFIVILTLTREVGVGTASYGSYTPAVERHEVVYPVRKTEDVENVIDIVKKAITSNEFFDVEELSHRRWNSEALIYCRVTYKEMWGVALSGVIGITLVNGMVRVFINTEISSIEEISVSVNNSIRALFVSKLIGKLKTDMETRQT